MTTMPAENGFELRKADGQVYAYIVAAEDYDRMKAELVALQTQVAKLERVREKFLAELIDVHKTSLPFPPTEEQIRDAKDNSHELTALIAELETR